MATFILVWVELKIKNTNKSTYLYALENIYKFFPTDFKDLKRKLGCKII